MSLVGQLIGFGLRQVFGEAADKVVEAVERLFRDHSQTLPKALERAHDRAWQALGIALAGDGMLDRVRVLFATGDDKGIREQVAIFLEGNAATLAGWPVEFRRTCLEELKRLRKSGLLSPHGLRGADVAREAVGFQRQADQPGMIDETFRAANGIADALVDGYPNLARLLRRPTLAEPSILVSAFCYFFRREVETDDELAHGLFFDGLRQLTASQAKAFGQVGKALDALGDRFDQAIDEVLQELGRTRLAAEQAAQAAAGAERAAAGAQNAAVATYGAILDIQVELQRQGERHTNVEEIRSLLVQVQQHLSQVGMQRGEVRPQHSFSIRGEDERRAVKDLVKRFRQLTPEEREKVPALLNGLGKLQIAAGDFGGAKETFAEVAQTVGDPLGKAEAFFNAYRAALEEKKWDEALLAICQASSLDPKRFTPFPLRRYQPQRILGAGGFGTVFLCQDAYFRNSEVAIKVLHTTCLTRTPEEVFAEAHALSELHHSAVIGVLHWGYADEERQANPFLVMPYFQAVSFSQYLRGQGPLPLADFWPVARQIASGMAAAHDKGILHLDLKPDNLLVRREGNSWEVKIIDFGLGGRTPTSETDLASGGGSEIVAGHGVGGTLLYAPPEQLGQIAGVQPGPYSDVYSFGKLCYAMLLGKPTHDDEEQLPDRLRKLIRDCSAWEVGKRPQTFLDVSKRLADGQYQSAAKLNWKLVNQPCHVWKIAPAHVRKQLTDPDDPKSRYHRVTGNRKALRQLGRFAEMVLGKGDHDAGSQAFALTGPFYDKPRIAECHIRDVLGLSFIEVAPQFPSVEKLFAAIKKELDHRGLSLVKQVIYEDQPYDYVIPPCGVFIADAHLMAKEFQSGVLPNVVGGDRTLLLPNGSKACTTKVHWMIGTTQLDDLLENLSHCFTAVQLSAV